MRNSARSCSRSRPRTDAPRTAVRFSARCRRRQHGQTALGPPGGITSGSTCALVTTKLPAPATKPLPRKPNRGLLVGCRPQPPPPRAWPRRSGPRARHVPDRLPAGPRCRRRSVFVAAGRYCGARLPAPCTASQREDLPWIHDVLRVERPLHLTHHLHRAGTGLVHQEAHLVQPDAMLSGAGAFQRNRALHHAAGSCLRPLRAAPASPSFTR